MKITEILYAKKSDVDKLPRFNMSMKPLKQKWYLRPLTWALGYKDIRECKSKVIKYNMDGLVGPYILLCNHNSFIDFMVTTQAVFPRPANYVVAIDGFIGREELLRNVGCICKRKFFDKL